MKKIIHNLSHILSGCLLATLLFATSLAGIFTGAGTQARETVTASAATLETEKPLGDDNFEFDYGASLRPKEYYGAEKTDFGKMGFILQIKNPDLEYRKYKSDRREYYFTFHRQNMDGTSTPVARYTVICQDEVQICYKQELAYTKDTFDINPWPPADWGKSLETSNPKEWEKEVAAYKRKGFDLISIYQAASSTDSDFRWREFKDTPYPCIHVYVDTTSVVADYFVEFEYAFKEAKTKRNWYFLWSTWETVYETKKAGDKELAGKIYSDVRSVKRILTNMDAAGKLEYEMNKHAEAVAKEGEAFDAALAVTTAQEIIAYQEEENVAVSYLQQIGSTPFARRVTETITVAKEGDVLRVDAVASKLNLDTFSALNAECYEFTYNPATNTYDAVYLKNVYLTIRTVDGNTPDAGSTTAEKYYLDVNQSFADYYGGLCKAGVISESQYEWLFSQILKQYPALSGYKVDEVYGCFGYAAIPETKYSINGFFANVFDLENSNAGVFIMQQWKENLSATQYDKLLTEYQYSWLEKTWHDVLNGMTGWNFNAVHFAFVAKDLTGNVVISDSGSTDIADNDGLIENTVQKVVVEIKDTISGDNEEGRGLKVILGVAIGGLAVFGIAYGVIKLKNLSESKK